MSTAEEQITALTRAVGGAEAGRRVGWARAYAAESSKDELSRDVNILRMERDIMRGAASFLFGFFRGYLEQRGDSHLAQTALSRWHANVDKVLDAKIVKAGREAAAAVAQQSPEELARRAKRAASRAETKQEKKARANQSARLFKHARDQERKLLMERFGFDNEAAMFNWLEQYPKR
jgi:hypothetical protein